MNTKHNIRIRGGKPLHGSIRIVPNKNAVLPAIAASLLTKHTMRYINAPMSPDVIKMLSVLKYLGADVDHDTATITICCKNVVSKPIPLHLIKDMQAGYLFAAGLLVRFGETTISIASGCALGYRGPEGHIEYFGELGVGHELTDQSVRFYLKESITDERYVEKERLEYVARFATYTQPKVTPTENILMLLAGSSRFKTEVSGIAQEPHVHQLIELLKEMGATIHGKGSTVQVIGSNDLRGATFVAEPDHIDYFGGVAMAVMTKSDIPLEMQGDRLAPGIVLMNKFIKQMGIVFETEGGNVRVLGSQSSYAPDDTFPREKHGDHTTFIMNCGPFPAFPVDALPAFIALSSMNANPYTSTFINNWMYQDGLKYIPAMQKMGANITLHDNQRVTIHGTSSGNPFAKNGTVLVDSPNVIEGSRAISYCAMAGGDHTINNAQYILRRSPEFFILHQRLGLDIDIFEPVEQEENGHS